MSDSDADQESMGMERGNCWRRVNWNTPPCRAGCHCCSSEPAACQTSGFGRQSNAVKSTDTLPLIPGQNGAAPSTNSLLEQPETSTAAASATPRAEGGSGGQATALACDTPSSEVGGGTAAEQPPECEAVATEPECGGSAEQSRSAQRPPVVRHSTTTPTDTA